MLSIVLAAVSIVLLVLVAKGVGATVVFGGAERPERILGATVALYQFDGLGPSPPSAVEATVQEWLPADHSYRVVFAAPQEIGGHVESFATVGARHAGYPVSAAGRWRVLAVTGYMQSGAAFIACLRRGAARVAA
jgi:hypothetical protein